VEAVSRNCTFCKIIARTEPAEILYEDDEVMVFRNRLHWVPVMLLAVPKAHRTQAELWGEMGRVGEIAVRMGREHCPNGFRLLSNFGYEAMQSQEHAHVHVLGGTFLGEYV
jgi:histidine triad (HIT) family protein